MENKDSVLSQEEINALVGGDIEKTEEFKLTEVHKDIMGEVGNIFMSTAATALAQVIGKEVSITTPVINNPLMEDIIDKTETDKVVTSIEFVEGVIGQNLLIMDLKDGLIITDLMMGGDGTNIDVEKGFSELELSALAEAMNQMMGAASTSMSKMLNRHVNITPPRVKIMEQEDLRNNSVIQEGYVCKVAFDLKVDGLIESQIMQVFDHATVSEIVNIMLEETEVESIQVEDSLPVEVEESVSEVEELEKENMADNESKVKIKKPVFPELEEEAVKTSKPRNLDLIMDVPLEFSVVLGKSRKTIKEILSFTSGSIVELDKLADEPLEIYVNGKLIASGEVVVINENFGIRITNILTKEERVQNLK